MEEKISQQESVPSEADDKHPWDPVSHLGMERRKE
jgi:hypothetical protein